MIKVIPYLQIRFTVGWKIIQPVISICKLLNFFIFQTKTVHNLPLIFGCSGLSGCFTFLSFSQEQISFRIGTDSTQHSMATANLNKNEDLVTNTTAASKYIPRRPRISINLNPPFQTSLHFFKNCFLWSKYCFTMFTFRGTFTK